MARFECWHFCDQVYRDNLSQKANLLGLFDRMTIRVPESSADIRHGLPSRRPTPPFAVVMWFSGMPVNAMVPMEFQGFGPDNQPVTPPFKARVKTGASGRLVHHLVFSHGMLIRKGGVHSFRVTVGGQVLPGGPEIEIDVVAPDEGAAHGSHDEPG